MNIYKLWHEYVQHFPKATRYTLGAKIDSLFIETIELLFRASYVSKDTRLPLILKAISVFDVLKFFMQIAWETKSLDTKKYTAISEQLNEIGKMLGGWLKQLRNQIPPK